MAKAKQTTAAYVPNNHRRTSIGKSPNTQPTNKSARRQHKKYRGQGG